MKMQIKNLKKPSLELCCHRASSPKTVAKTSGDRSRQVFSDLSNNGAEKNWRRFRGLPVCHSAETIPEGKWVAFNYDRKWEGGICWEAKG